MIFRIPLILCSIAFTSAAPAMEPPALPLVPLPARVTPGEGAFRLESSTSLVAAKPAEKRAAELLASWLRPATGLALAVRENDDTKTIRFTLDPKLSAELGGEGYQLDCRPDGVTIRAAEDAGLLYGAQTFRQLLPAQAFRSTKAEDLAWTAPAVSIQDRPRFAWRAFMQDVSRHFFTLDDLHRLVDDMSAQKLNLLQLHLTDDEGWRVEIKKFPKLTEIGAWRGTECALPNTFKDEHHKRYGGFYTQEQLKELVAYAKARNVNIMPEIDLPGHALAIVTAYPDTLPSKLSEAMSTQGFSANAISPAKESNYRMISDIIDEVAAIFPFPYIHIGGDEVNHKVWDACPEIKALMEKEKLTDLHQVQVLFTKRLEGILESHGKKMIGWQEIADPRLKPQTGIMSWIGPQAGWDAARRGTPAVMAPGSRCYFDMACPGGEDEPKSHWWAGQVSLRRVYEFDPLAPSAGLDEAASKNILGVQAALFAEFVTGWTSKTNWLTLKDEGECAQYKIWPRLCATAEIGWTPQELREFTGFSHRMGGQYARMAEAGRKFRLEQPTAQKDKDQILITPPWPQARVKFTTDGSDPLNSPTAALWDGTPIDGRHRSTLAMRTVMPEYQIASPLARGAALAPPGTWNVAAWPKGQTQTLTYPVAEHIPQAGRWKVTMRKVQGSDGLVVDRMELRAAGNTIATATPGRNGNVILEVNSPPPSGLELVVAAHFTGDKPQADGHVSIEKLTAKIIPGTKIETAIPHDGDIHHPDQLLDGDPETFFRSSRKLEAGETVTWVLPEATAIKSLKLQSGLPNDTKDQLTDAVLEVSTDGANFSTITGFYYGEVRANLGGKPIKAIRIRATGQSASPAILQDLTLQL